MASRRARSSILYFYNGFFGVVVRKAELPSPRGMRKPLMGFSRDSVNINVYRHALNVSFFSLPPKTLGRKRYCTPSHCAAWCIGVNRVVSR